MEYTNAQLCAISHDTGPALTIAGPGSGKTTVITERIRYLIRKKGVDPDRILVITFTRAAAEEMKLRFKAAQEGRNTLVWFFTFHSFCFKILSHAYNLNYSNILKDNVKYALLREITSGMVITRDNEADFFSALISEISYVKNNSTDIDKYESKQMDAEIFRGVYREYNRRLSASYLVDFDDMLIKTNELFVKRPDYLKKWIARFDRIMVDEAQDMNYLQYEMLELISGEKNNVFLVGDDDQSIYSFRGADAGILKRFTTDHKECAVYEMTENFRSRSEIVGAAGVVISKAADRFDKRLISARGKGGIVDILSLEDKYEEGLKLAEMIRDAVSTGESYSDNAILLRTNKQAEVFSDILSGENIPVRCSFSGGGIFERSHVKDIISYLRLSSDRDMRRSDFLNVMNKPLRYFSREALQYEIVTWDSLLEFYRGKDHMIERIDEFCGELSMIGRLPAFAAINYIRKGIGYDQVVADRCAVTKERMDDIMNDLDIISSVAKKYSSIPDLLSELSRLREASKKKEPVGDAVNIMTLHAAKGLEYKRVFIPDVVEGVLPYRLSVLEDEVDQERRLLYVGMTRAKEELYLFTRAGSSRFLQDLIATGEYSCTDKS